MNEVTPSPEQDVPPTLRQPDIVASDDSQVPETLGAFPPGDNDPTDPVHIIRGYN